MSEIVKRLRKLADRERPYGSLPDTLEEAAARIEQLEGQHKGLVLQNALLRQRPDLPVDRIPAAAEVRTLIDRIKQLEAALRVIMGLPGEINHSNYDHDDVVALNNSFCEAFHIARAALEGK